MALGFTPPTGFRASGLQNKLAFPLAGTLNQMGSPEEKNRSSRRILWGVPYIPSAVQLGRGVLAAFHDHTGNQRK